MIQVTILNQTFRVSQFREVHSGIKDLIQEYASDPNCRPWDWINSESVTELEKAAFIHYALPYFTTANKNS